MAGPAVLIRWGVCTLPRPPEYNSWMVFRLLVNIVLGADLVTYITFTYVYWDIPSTIGLNPPMDSPHPYSQGDVDKDLASMFPTFSHAYMEWSKEASKTC